LCPTTFFLAAQRLLGSTASAAAALTVFEPDNPHALIFRQMAARIWDKVADAGFERRPPPRSVIE